MSRLDIAGEDERKSLQDWWTLHSELAEHGVDLSRDYIVKTVNERMSTRRTSIRSVFLIKRRRPRTFTLTINYARIQLCLYRLQETVSTQYHLVRSNNSTWSVFWYCQQGRLPCRTHRFHHPFSRPIKLNPSCVSKMTNKINCPGESRKLTFLKINNLSQQTN